MGAQERHVGQSRLGGRCRSNGNVHHCCDRGPLPLFLRTPGRLRTRPRTWSRRFRSKALRPRSIIVWWKIWGGGGGVVIAVVVMFFNVAVIAIALFLFEEH